MIKKITLLALLLSILCLGGTGVFAASYEELPDVLRVEGFVTDGGEVLCSAEVVEHSTVDRFENLPESYVAKLVDGDGGILLEQNFPISDNIFFFNLPYDENVDVLEVFSPSQDKVCDVQRSAHNPVVEITSPASGESYTEVEKITWDMSDLDQDDWLLANVYVAGNKGLGWSMVGYQVEDPFLLLDVPVEATRVMVTVSDGFNSTSSVIESKKAKNDVFENVEYQSEQIYSYTDPEEEYLKASDLEYEVVTERGKIGSSINISIDGDWVIGIVAGIFFLLMIFFAVKKRYGLASVALIFVLGGGFWFGYQLMSGVIPAYESESNVDKVEYEDDYHDYEEESEDNYEAEEFVGSSEVLDVIASSELMWSNEDYDYSPDNIVDGDYATAWIAENVLNDWIKIDLEQDITIDTLQIFPGYAETSDLYFMNNRLKEILVEFSDGTDEIFYLEDLFQPVELTFSPRETGFVVIEVLDVYEGENNNTCIAEVSFDSYQP